MIDDSTVRLEPGKMGLPLVANIFLLAMVRAGEWPVLHRLPPCCNENIIACQTTKDPGSGLSVRVSLLWNPTTLLDGAKVDEIKFEALSGEHLVGVSLPVPSLQMSIDEFMERQAYPAALAMLARFRAGISSA